LSSDPPLRAWHATIDDPCALLAIAREHGKWPCLVRPREALLPAPGAGARKTLKSRSIMRLKQGESRNRKQESARHRIDRRHRTGHCQPARPRERGGLGKWTDTGTRG